MIKRHGPAAPGALAKLLRSSRMIRGRGREGRMSKISEYLRAYEEHSKKELATQPITVEDFAKDLCRPVAP